MQNDLTNEIAEKALLNYLYKLDQVARLEICGTFLQDDQSTLHVFGRTMAGSRRSYYYRRLLDYTTWTPWEKIDLDIQGLQGGDGTDEHPGEGIDLLPTVWNNHLYVAWLIFTKKTDKGSQPPPETIVTQIKTSTQPQPYWQISLAWSKYDQGKWTPKQTSGEQLLTYKITTPLTEQAYFFRLRARVTSSSLVFDVLRNIGASGQYTRIGGFRFDDYHGSIIKDDNRTGIVDPISIGISTNYFMNDNLPSGVPLNFVLLGGQPVFIFTKTKNLTHGLLSLNQYYPVYLPHFYYCYEGSSLYFVRTTGIYQLSLAQIADPDAVLLPLPKMNASNIPIITDTIPIFTDHKMSVITNPWISAEQQLAPKTLKDRRKQSGEMW
jgi:hypothetical protein